jgi:hypothetical protein
MTYAMMAISSRLARSSPRTATNWSAMWCESCHRRRLPLTRARAAGGATNQQRRGVGGALMHRVLAAADALDVPAVVVLGDPGYYRRFGFELVRAFH